ncbi:MAG: DotI/IcmL family type IV secretion protein [Alphaproteobacteria bacterium]|nr:DotI/IcmL family type IV secretion protein [Alphaproteobacteria bacterium]
MKRIFAAALCAALLCTGITTPYAADNSWMTYNDPYADSNNDLRTPHRTNAEVSLWATQAIVTALSFKHGDYKERLASHKKYFQASGWHGYAQYLKNIKLVDVIKSERYNVATISSSQALLLGGGVKDGVYQWKITLPVITSIAIPGPNDGEQKTVSDTAGRITVVVARAKNSTDLSDKPTQDDDTLTIVAWDGRLEHNSAVE